MYARPRGLRVDFYRAASGADCTLGGISSTCTGGVVTHLVTHEEQGLVIRQVPRDSAVTEPTDTRPALWLYGRQIGSWVWAIIPGEDVHPGLVTDYQDRGDRERGVVYGLRTPEDLRGYVAQWMAGGNYAASNDERFADMLACDDSDPRFYGAIAVHDRSIAKERRTEYGS